MTILLTHNGVPQRRFYAVNLEHRQQIIHHQVAQIVHHGYAGSAIVRVKQETGQPVMLERADGGVLAFV